MTSVITGTHNNCRLSAARPRTNLHTRKDETCKFLYNTQ